MILIKLIIITSTLCLGATVSHQEGMVFGFTNKWIEKQRSWIDPIIGCVWCMPSLWSIVGFLFAYKLGVIKVLNLGLIWYYPLVICGSSLLNGLVWNTYLKISSGIAKDESIKDLCDVIIEINISDIETEEEFEERVFDNQHN